MIKLSQEEVWEAYKKLNNVLRDPHSKGPPIHKRNIHSNGKELLVDIDSGKDLVKLDIFEHGISTQDLIGEVEFMTPDGKTTFKVIDFIKSIKVWIK